LVFSQIAHEANIDPEAVKLFLLKMTGHKHAITVGNLELEK
jgi:hypothetical protein